MTPRAQERDVKNVPAICLHCTHWSPYLPTLGECTRTVPMHDVSATDSCRAWSYRAALTNPATHP